MKSEEKASVLSFSQAGIAPSHILTALKQQNEHMNALPQDIYNLRAVHRAVMLAGRTPLQTLLDGLASTASANYSLQQHPGTKELSHLFILFPSAKQICQEYSRGEIWLIDATYKTNRYGLPLLHVVGLTATNSNFTLCYCVMRNETVADYRWSMSKLSEVFQNFGIEHQHQTLTLLQTETWR